MRVIGGKYKGRRIAPPGSFSSRPTTDLARESLFNILTNRVDFEEISVLDLFAGTGSISFEFASRGVESVHLVEKDFRHIAGIKKVIKELGITGIRTVHIDVKAFLRTCTSKYDIVFADPPYDLHWLKEIPGMVLGSGVLKENGFLILEHPSGTSFKEAPGYYEHRTYGRVNFSFFASSPPL